MGTKSILIVDDFPENIDVLKQILKPYYGVRVATGGRLALKIAGSSQPPDLILLDVMMPELDGYEVCRILKADEATRHIPVIFVTALSEADDEARGFDLGCDDYIAKPVNARVVLARVRTHLALHDRSQQLEALVAQRTETLEARTRELQDTRQQVLSCLSRATDYRDNETGMHVIRIGQYVSALARTAGLAEPEIEYFGQAALMHDIGKIGCQANLNKPGKLSAEEYEIFKIHPTYGKDILEPITFLRPIIPGVHHHHERWDGTGYPDHLQGEAIPLAARILAVADTYDAMTSSRAYRKALSHEVTMQEIRRCAGAQFDPGVVEAFERAIDRHREECRRRGVQVPE